MKIIKALNITMAVSMVRVAYMANMVEMVQVVKVDGNMKVMTMIPRTSALETMSLSLTTPASSSEVPSTTGRGNVCSRHGQ